MANSVSILHNLRAASPIWRILLLFALSQLVISKLVREKMQEFVRSRRPQNNIGKEVKLVPLASPPTNWVAALFLGHFAEIEPWKKSGFVINLFNRRFGWYEDVKSFSKSFRVKLVTDDFVFTQDLEMIRAISGKEDRLFRNSDTIRRAWGVMFPESMTVRTGDKWKRVRRVFVSAMNKLDFEVLPPSTNEVLEVGLKNYLKSDSQEVFLWDVYAKVTFDSFHKFVYDINFNTVSGENLQVLEDLMTIASTVSDRLFITIPLVWKLPIKSNKILWDCHKRLCTFVDGYVEERTKLFLDSKNSGDQNSKKFTNLLDALILACHEESSEEQDGVKAEKHLSREEMRAQLCAAMFGGFDTTTSSMSMITCNLARNPECQVKLYEEVKDIDLSKATGSQLEDLPYLNSVIKETLRMHAVAPAVARIPNEDVVLNGYLLKEGTNILADHEALGLRPELWNNANDLDQFRPERWIDFTPAKGAFFPFGFGGRQCPGYKVANNQMRVITTFINQNYSISLSDRPIQVVASLGRTVSRDTSVIFTKRK